MSESEYIDYDEAHHFVNGICKECGYEVTVQPTEAPTPTPMPSTTYSLDVSGVSKSGVTSGLGKVVATPDYPEDSALYIRMTWVYTLSDDSSFAYAAMKSIRDDLTFDTTSPRLPFGATLDDVYFALVEDPEADVSGSYVALVATNK